MNSIERLLQLCLNNIQNWADENGFQFSKTKTVCMHFCQKYTLHNDPDIKIYGSTIPVVEEYKFLGLYFDKKLNFIPHIRYLKNRCLKAMNLLKVVAHKDWGADCATLLKLYRSLVRSKLDYGCIVYGSARDSYLQSLDRVQNAALRICLGAFRTSPIPSLHVEAGELPPDLRRQKLTLQFITKLKSNPSNPAYKCVFQPSYALLFEARPSVIPSLGVRVKQHLSDSEISLDLVAQTAISPIPPWMLQPPEFIFDLHLIGSKSETPSYVFHTGLNQILSNFDGFTRLYTDGSKDGPSVAAAAICGTRIIIKRLPNHSSIFSAEARAILLALETIELFNNDRFLLMTDSMSCLQSIEGRMLNHPIILDIVLRIHQLLSDGKRFIFLWVPSHIGIAGNTAADAAAKAALSLPETDLPVPYSDLYPCVSVHIARRWQQSWDTETNNKLHSIEPKLKLPKPYNLPRRDELLIHRLRIGHTHLTHAYLLKRENPPECVQCQVPLTVEHILLDCVDFNFIRQKHFSVTTLTDLFNKTQPRTIIDFIKEIGLHRKL